MKEEKNKNPWLGLESYQEGDVLYGRDDDIRDLSQNVLYDTATLLYGRSGIGKSSLLNAGVIPVARRHGYLPVLIRFSHEEDAAYLDQIRDAIESVSIPMDKYGNPKDLSEEELAKRKIRIKKVVDCKDKDKESLYEFFHRHTFHDMDDNRIKLLIIFDQFEEIFTLQTKEAKRRRFFAELADLLNDIIPNELQREIVSTSDAQEIVDVVEGGDYDELFKDIDLSVKYDAPEYVSDNDIHYVFSIREDFLSEFEYYSAVIPSLRQNRYGLRPINEEQASQIILRPMPGLIDEDVARLIIAKITGKTDFKFDDAPEIEVDSAVLSLYLNRLYDAKAGNRITSELVEQKGGEIIYNFYIDAISGISEYAVKYLEDNLITQDGIRDNLTKFDVEAESGLTNDELNSLVKEKKILREFNYAKAQRIEFVHDILCPVVKKHKEERLLQEQKRKIEKKNRLRLRIIALVVLLVALFSALGIKKMVVERDEAFAQKDKAIAQKDKAIAKMVNYTPDDPFLLFMGGGSVYKFIEEKGGVRIDSICKGEDAYPNSIYMPIATGNLWGMIAEECYRKSSSNQEKFYPLFMAANKIDTCIINNKVSDIASLKNEILIIELNLGKDTTAIYFDNESAQSSITKRERCLDPSNVRKVIDMAMSDSILYTTSLHSGTFTSFKSIFHDYSMNRLFHGDLIKKMQRGNSNKTIKGMLDHYSSVLHNYRSIYSSILREDSMYVDNIFRSGRKEFHEKYPVSVEDRYIVLGSVFYHPDFGSLTGEAKKRMYYVVDYKGNFYAKNMCLYFCAYKKGKTYIIPGPICGFINNFLRPIFNKRSQDIWEFISAKGGFPIDRVPLSHEYVVELAVEGFSKE